MFVTDEIFAKLKKNHDSIIKEGVYGNCEKMNLVMSEHISLLNAETALVFSKLLMNCCVEHAQKTIAALSMPSDFDDQGNFSEQMAIKFFKLSVNLMKNSVYTETYIKSEECAKKEFAEKVKTLKNNIVASVGVEGFKDMLKKF